MSKVKKIVLILISVIFIFGMCCIPVSALQDVWFACDKPQITDTSGYVELVCSQGKFVFVVYTYEYDNPYFSVFTDSNGYIYFKASVYENGVLKQVPCYSYYIKQDGNVLLTAYDNDCSYYRAYNIYKISGYNVDCSLVTASVPAEPYAFYYSAEVIISDKLNQIINALNSSSGNANQIVNGITNNQNANTDKITGNQNANTDKITGNQNANTDKITQNEDKNTQQIIDNQNQIQQNEKDETQNSGEQSVDDVSGAIEDKSAGFISAMGGLVNAMSYNGTDCSWQFPALKLPAIEGLMPEYQLTSAEPINFEYWVEQIPSNILLLIRSVLTIGLIVFCFKELYSTISYVLTLKGGGNNE